MPKIIKMIITDFDGVITDGRVWTMKMAGNGGRFTLRLDARPPVARTRIQVMILSSEVNPVVKARAEKMGVEAIHGFGS